MPLYNTLFRSGRSRGEADIFSLEKFRVVKPLSLLDFCECSIVDRIRSRAKDQNDQNRGKTERFADLLNMRRYEILILVQNDEAAVGQSI